MSVPNCRARRVATGSEKNIQAWPALPRPGPLNGHFNTHLPCRGLIGQRVGIPSFFVEIGGDKHTGVVFAYGVGSYRDTALKMLEDYRFIEGRKLTVCAFPAPHLRLAADTPHPFGIAGRGVAHCPFLLALPQLGEDVVATAKESQKKGEPIRKSVRRLFTRGNTKEGGRR